MSKSFLVSPKLTIMKKDRQRLNKHKPAVIWFTGFSGAGKSTLAYKLNEVLFNRKVQGRRTFAGLGKWQSCLWMQDL